ncbi:hypothetical protein J6590_003275 [Homalodisca vitripennis]|nr:hypothetical protein J6590_003275 [Homalodisca vitripennis]
MRENILERPAAVMNTQLSKSLPLPGRLRKSPMHGSRLAETAICLAVTAVAGSEWLFISSRPAPSSTQGRIRSHGNLTGHSLSHPSHVGSNIQILIWNRNHPGCIIVPCRGALREFKTKASCILKWFNLHPSEIVLVTPLDDIGCRAVKLCNFPLSDKVIELGFGH